MTQDQKEFESKKTGKTAVRVKNRVLLEKVRMVDNEALREKEGIKNVQRGYLLGPFLG